MGGARWLPHDLPLENSCLGQSEARGYELCRSPNGDRWYLAREPETGRLFVRHKANFPSGGQVTDIDIGAFLSGGRRHPEHQALFHLIGTLVESDCAA